MPNLSGPGLSPIPMVTRCATGEVSDRLADAPTERRAGPTAGPGSVDRRRWQRVRGWGVRACGLGLMVWVGGLSGCASSPWLAQRAAREISKENLAALADEGSGDHLLYLGSQGGYHYLRDSRSAYAAPFKVDDRALKLGQTFPLQSEEPYVVYPHVIAGRKLGQKPRTLPGF